MMFSYQLIQERVFKKDGLLKPMQVLCSDVCIIKFWKIWHDNSLQNVNQLMCF